MSDETPAAAAAPIAVAELQTAPGLTLTSGHVFTGGALGGLGVGGYELFSPLVHWAVTGGTPDDAAQKSISLIATIAAGALVALARNWLTRARPVQAASSNGVSNAS